MNFSPFDRTVASMMSKFGTTAYIVIAAASAYDPNTSENIVTYRECPVKAMFFDYLKKTEGDRSDTNTLIKTGDKQVFVQPPQKSDEGITLPHFSPNKDFLKINGVLYKIITLKQINPPLSSDGCVLYELYIRE